MGRRTSGVVMDLRPGDSLALGPGVRIRFLAKSGRITRVHIAAPLDMRIHKDAARIAQADASMPKSAASGVS